LVFSGSIPFSFFSSFVPLLTRFFDCFPDKKNPPDFSGGSLPGSLIHPIINLSASA
jgi:hypothetical protein